MSCRVISELLTPPRRRKRGSRLTLLIAWILIGVFETSICQDFRIDNQLSIVANDCYTRIAIGSRLPDSNVVSMSPASSLSDCETACSRNRTICNAFSFGIDSMGNGTCRIGQMNQNMRGNDFVVDPEYDVYERRPRMPRGCHHDRLLRIEYGARLSLMNGTGNMINGTVGMQGLGQPAGPGMGMGMGQSMGPGMGTGQPMGQGMGQSMGPGMGTGQPMGQGNVMMINRPPGRRPNPFGNPLMAGPLENPPSREPSFFRGGWYSPLADDNDSRLYDIIINKNQKPHHWKTPQFLYPPYGHGHWPQSHNYDSSPHEFQGHNDLYVHRSTSLGHKEFPEKWTPEMPTNTKWDSGTFLNSKWNSGGAGVQPQQNPRQIQFSAPKDSPEREAGSVFDRGVGFGYQNGLNFAVDPLLEKTKACYRKLLSGKRLAERHVRKSHQCNRIEDCHRMCEYESTFVCEGFNYGRMQQDGRAGHSNGDYMCQLSSMPGSRMDLRRDFAADPRYDYYERDWRCPAEKPGGNAWSNEPRRPSHWQSPLPLGPPHRGSPNEIPRPIHQPIDRYPGDPNMRFYLPEKGPRPAINRPEPNYDYYLRPASYLSQRPPPELHYHRHQQIPPYFSNDNYYQPISPARPYGAFPTYPDRRVDHDWDRRLPVNTRPNEIPLERNWPKPPRSDWPVPEVYGPSYGYHTNRYSGVPEPPRRMGDTYPRDGGNRSSPQPQRRPNDQQDFYGYNYGPAYGYNGQREADSYIPSWKSQRYPQISGSRDCSVRSATGFKLSRKIVDSSYTTANLEECEMLCALRSDCFTFAYRYSLAATAPTDNCLLSNIPFAKLNFYTELEPDRDYDIYAIIDELRVRQNSKKPGNHVRPNRPPPEECFWRVRSGFGIPISLTRKELRVENGLGECQTACVSARQFTCRSFVFRYESERDRAPNCFLSDCPTSEIIPAEGLPHIDEAELYERGSYGRGCEPYPFAAIYNPEMIGKLSGGGNPGGGRSDEACYSGYRDGCKLSPYAVSSMSTVDSENECRRKCSIMRHSPHTPCMSYSFKVGDEKRGDNCYLSDVPRRDLRPGLDYTYDDDYVMFAWKELEPQCTMGPIGYPQNDKFNRFYYDTPGGGGGGGGFWSGGPAPGGPPPPLGPGTGLISYNHLVLGVQPIEPNRPDPINPPDYGMTSSPPMNNDANLGFGPPAPNGFANFNQYYTVSGYPCKRGTKCEKNQIVGFWSCEPEGSELGSWDYCCEPNHHCGFSQGYRYPWCYVGPSEDQWRPCSDKYFPYLPSPRPALNPYRPTGQANNDKGSSTYNSRHWPIAFLHPEPPPNTTDSVALPNDRRDDHTTNDTSSAHSTTSKPRENPSDMSNSSITRLQLHQSHLKRRGLVSNRTRTLTKSPFKKIHRIKIIPAVPRDDNSLENQIKLNQLDNLDYYNSSRTTRDDVVSVVHVGTSTTVGSNEKKEKVSAGRIERVSKPRSSQ